MWPPLQHFYSWIGIFEIRNLILGQRLRNLTLVEMPERSIVRYVLKIVDRFIEYNSPWEKKNIYMYAFKLFIFLVVYKCYFFFPNLRPIQPKRFNASIYLCSVFCKKKKNNDLYLMNEIILIVVT